MIEVEDIGNWRGHDIVDPDGAKIGEMAEVYIDTAADEPAFATVKTGMVGRHRLSFVPLARISVGPEYLRVAYPKKMVKDAPSIDPGADLPADAEAEIYRYYELRYDSAPTSSGRRLARR